MFFLNFSIYSYIYFGKNVPIAIGRHLKSLVFMQFILLSPLSKFRGILIIRSSALVLILN